MGCEIKFISEGEGRGTRMTKFICDICKEDFTTADDAFDHLVEKHGDKLESKYILEE